MPDIRGEFTLTRFQDQFPELVPVQVTAVTLTAGTYYYSWTEQSTDVNGNFTPCTSARAGDATNGPFLVEINNTNVAVPFYTWMRARGYLKGQVLWEFSYCCTSPITINKPQYVTLTTSQNNYGPPTSSELIITNNTANINITGIVAGSDGQTLTITNSSSSTFNVTLTNQDTNSTAANRFNITVNQPITPGTSYTITYSAAPASPINRWLPTASSNNYFPTPTAIVSDALTVTASTAYTITHSTSGTPGTGYGITVNTVLQDASGNLDTAYQITVAWNNAIDGSELSGFTQYVVSGASLEPTYTADAATGGANLSFFTGYGVTNYQGGVGTLFVPKATTNPTGLPTGGTLLYADHTTGALMCSGPTGVPNNLTTCGGAVPTPDDSQNVITQQIFASN